MEKDLLNILSRVKNILELIGYTEDPIVTKRDKVFLVRIQIDEPGYLIGKQGEALDALQHIIRLVSSRDLELTDHLIVVDINGYRDKKINKIEQTAKELAHKVRETGTEEEMSFLNSFERRVVHSIVNSVSDVESESKGEGINRKIVIKRKKQ